MTEPPQGREHVIGSTTIRASRGIQLPVAFTLRGEPVAKMRHRMANGHTYTPRETVEAQKAIAWAYRAAGGKMLDGPLQLHCAFLVRGRTSAAHLDPRDVDNLVKLVKDALEGVAYSNDRRITHVYAYKARPEPGQDPCTIVTIGPVTPRAGNQTATA